MKNKPPVLIVEDDKRQSDLIIELVNETGLYQPVAAYNGIEAQEIMKQNRRGFDFLTNRIACILLDWQMAEMNGEEFLIALRKKEAKKPFKRFTPVIIISAYGDEERRRLAENPTLGMASAYLTKPFDEKHLLNLMYRIVYQHDAEVLRELLTERRHS